MDEQERCIIRRRRGEREDLMITFCSRSVLSDLPDSLLSEILYRLPLKSIFRSKSVSKSWLSHISDPLFARSYPSSSGTIIIDDDGTIIESRATWTLLFRYGSALYLSPDDLWLHFLKRRHPTFRSPNFTLRFLSDAGAGRDDLKPPVVVLAVSNGLILSTATRHWQDCYYICNPLTKQWSALPKPPRIHQWVTLGFIVEPFDGSFQVLRIGGYTGSSNVVNFEILSSKTRKWTDKMAWFDLPVRLFLGKKMHHSLHQAVPCKKILHWMEYDYRIITYDTTQNENDDETRAIECGLIDLPGEQVTGFEPRIDMIGVCRDHLRYIQLVRKSQKLSIWELRKYNNSNNNNKEEGEKEKEEYWVLLHRIRCGNLNMGSSLQFGNLVAFHPLNPDIVYVVVVSSPFTLASLHLRSRVCRDIYALKDVLSWWTVFPFVLPPWPTPVRT